MKRLFYLSCIAMLVVACRPEDRSARLMDDFQALQHRVNEQITDDTPSEEADSLWQAYIEEAFGLQQAAPESEAAYFILPQIYHSLSLEQKEQAFAVLNLDSLHKYDLNVLYTNLQAEQRTAVGKQYTDFTALDLGDAERSLSEWVGRTDFLLIDFWASWCGPCRRSMPGIRQLTESYPDRLTVVGISVDRDKEEWLNAVEQLKLSWPQLRQIDRTGSDIYGIMYIPHTILISREGIILAHNPSHEQIAAILQGE